MKLNRIANDAYYTSSKLTKQLLLKYPISTDKVILECCSGNGHISNYLKQLGYKVLTNDIDKTKVSDYALDVTDRFFWDVIEDTEAHPTVVTNPPFNAASTILENALEISDEVIMLLRLSFLETTKDRKDVMNKYKDNLVKVVTVNPRPKFREDTTNTDSVTVAWFVWNKKHSWDALNIDYPFDFINNWK